MMGNRIQTTVGNLATNYSIFRGHPNTDEVEHGGRSEDFIGQVQA